MTQWAFEDILSIYRRQGEPYGESVEHIWLQSYPPGMPTTVNIQGYSSLVDLLDKSAEKYSDLKAVSNMGVALTFRELKDLSIQFAAFIQQEWQLEPGSRFAIMLPNTLQYYVAMFGALRAGLIVVNVNPMYTKRELIEQLSDSGSVAIITFANVAHVLQQAIPQTAIKHVIVTNIGDMFPPLKRFLVNFAIKYIKHGVPTWSIPQAKYWTDVMSTSKNTFHPVPVLVEDTAFLQYTGGTTGVAKGVILSHRNLLVNAEQCILWTKGMIEEGKEVFVAPLPLYHIFSLTLCCFTMLKLGGEVILITDPRNLKSVISTLSKYRYTMFTGINTLYNALNHQPTFKKLDFSALKIATAGGMATNKSVSMEWYSITGRFITEGYGLTEASPVVCINRADINEYQAGIGLPLPETEVDIRDDEGKSVAIGEVGELCVRGPQVMKGYWQRPEETREVLSEDGWLRTGDIAKIDATGHIFLIDRKKDMILVSGFNVYPNEVEEVIMSHPGVLEVAVIGVKNATGNEDVAAYIVPKDTKLNEESIIAVCHENLTGYKRPKFIYFVSSLPKSPVGKILKRELRESVKAA